MPSKIMIPRIIKTLTEFGESALKPLITKNKYYGPLVSKRNQADLRKRSIVEGTYGQFIPNVGGWDSKWDVPKKMFVIKPNKGHSYERNRQDRANKITNAMKAMPEKLAKHNQDIAGRKPKKDLPQLIKRVLTLSKSNVQYRKRDF